MEIISADAGKSKRASADWFTGAVWMEVITVSAPPSRLRAYRVTFEPGARTAWHTHPLGQVLHVLSGIGSVQTEGGQVLTIRPGDTVRIAPGEKHWHGASPDHLMVHLAIHEVNDAGTEVVWDDLVTDAEYFAG